MNARELQDYIYDHIPVVGVNQLEIEGIDGDVVSVRGRYDLHINHRNSVFGGSIGTATTLASWAQMRMFMEHEGLADRAVIVVQRHSVDFLLPVLTDFTARGQTIAPDDKERFMSILHRHKRAKLEVSAELRDEKNVVCARANGIFAVFLS
jgi:thioesterase domain-containing protein